MLQLDGQDKISYEEGVSLKLHPNPIPVSVKQWDTVKLGTATRHQEVFKESINQWYASSKTEREETHQSKFRMIHFRGIWNLDNNTTHVILLPVWQQTFARSSANLPITGHLTAIVFHVVIKVFCYELLIDSHFNLATWWNCHYTKPLNYPVWYNIFFYLCSIWNILFKFTGGTIY